MSNGSANPQNSNNDGNGGNNNQQNNQPQQQNQPQNQGAGGTPFGGQQQPVFQPQHHNTYNGPTGYQAPQNSGPDTNALLGAINSIPEKIVHGFREAFTPAQQPSGGTPGGGQQQSNQSAQGQQNSAQNGAQGAATGSQGAGGASGRGDGGSGGRGNGGSGEPGRKSFADWWFGK